MTTVTVSGRHGVTVMATPIVAAMPTDAVHAARVGGGVWCTQNG